jgi:hypothetical protein
MGHYGDAPSRDLENFPLDFGEGWRKPVSMYLAGGKEKPGSWEMKSKNPSLPGIGSSTELGTRTGTVIESTPRIMGKEVGPSSFP